MTGVYIIKKIVTIVIFVCSSKYDALYYEIQNKFSIVLMIIGVADRLSRIKENGDVTNGLIIPILFITLFYSILYFLSFGGIGGGDVKLLMGLGISEGYWCSIWCFVIAALLFIIVRLMKAVNNKKSIVERYPLSPYLLVAYIVRICVIR